MSGWNSLLPKNQILRIITIATNDVNFSESAKLYFANMGTDLLRIITLKADKNIPKGKLTLKLEHVEKAIAELEYPYFDVNFNYKPITSGEFLGLSGRTHGIYATKLERIIRRFKMTNFKRISADILPVMAESLIRYLQQLAKACEIINKEYRKITIYPSTIKVAFKLGKYAIGYK